MDKNEAVIHKGDIFGPATTIENGNNKHLHYMVYLEPLPANHEFFIGALLTHAAMNNNIPLHKDHFIETDENGELYKVTFDNSMIANHPVYKKNNLDASRIAGRLSKKGIDFIEENIAPYERQFIDKNID